MGRLTTERCELTELLVDQCACRRHRNIADPAPQRLGRPFASVYAGRCVDCDRLFRPGDRIRRDGEGGYLGPCCASEGGEPR